MKLIKKLIGISVFTGILISSVVQLNADRLPDKGKNFTVSDSPQSTVFNLKNPSTNRHIHDSRESEPELMPVGDCDPGVVMDSIVQYDVDLKKSAPATVSLNEPYAYNYIVTAKQDLKQVVVREQIPTGSTFVSSTPEAEVSGEDVTWTLYNLINGTEIPLELVVKPTSALELSNCATIEAIQNACTTTLVGVPELAIVKTTPNERVMLGDDVPWNITVSNIGNFCAYEVIVTDTLPVGISHLSGSSEVVEEIGTLAPGESRDIMIDSTADIGGNHCNVVSASASNAAPVEDDTCINVVEAGLEITKTGTEIQFVGKRVSYEIVVKNTGDIALDDVIVTDTVPPQNKLLAAENAQINGNTATWAVSLDAQESMSFEVTVLGLEAGKYCNQVSVASETYDLNGIDNACTEWGGYPALLIEVIDTDDPLLLGEQTTYEIEITNQGTAADTNVDLQVQLPAELALVSAYGDTQGTITGNNVSFAPYSVLNAKEIIQFSIVAKAVAVGDARFKAQLNSDLLQSPVPEEEATQVY